MFSSFLEGMPIAFPTELTASLFSAAKEVDLALAALLYELNRYKT